MFAASYQSVNRLIFLKDQCLQSVRLLRPIPFVLKYFLLKYYSTFAPEARTMAGH